MSSLHLIQCTASLSDVIFFSSLLPVVAFGGLGKSCVFGLLGETIVGRSEKRKMKEKKTKETERRGESIARVRVRVVLFCIVHRKPAGGHHYRTYVYIYIYMIICSTLYIVMNYNDIYTKDIIISILYK